LDEHAVSGRSYRAGVGDKGKVPGGLGSCFLGIKRDVVACDPPEAEDGAAVREAGAQEVVVRREGALPPTDEPRAGDLPGWKRGEDSGN
jgi:hypothetical protein